MIAIVPTMTVPTPDVADLEAVVAEAERHAYAAQVYAASTRAARVQAYTAEVRRLADALTVEPSPAIRTDWEGASSMAALDGRVRDVVDLTRRAQQELQAYRRSLARCARLAPTTHEGSI